ncbi:MAG TPA: hypothetical protein PKE21_05365, partial [Flavobacteriales bacterium]|nr:hypothetical protein [Flavobacteriales bacterium]HMR26889.1 hypothetical protein [Flavobacteriales bacterium]
MRRVAGVVGGVVQAGAQGTIADHGLPQHARELLGRAKEWAQAVQRRVLAPHRLRIDGGDRFQAFPLPNAVRLQLLRQPAAPAPVLVALVVPVTPCMRLLDKVAVHLRPPCRRRRRPTGHWQPLTSAPLHGPGPPLHTTKSIDMQHQVDRHAPSGRSTWTL